MPQTQDFWLPLPAYSEASPPVRVLRKQSSGMMVRLMERSGQSVYLLLCTLYDERQGKGIQQRKELSQKLSSSIKEALRRGDVYTCYNLSQYLVIRQPVRQHRLNARNASQVLKSILLLPSVFQYFSISPAKTHRILYLLSYDGTPYGAFRAVSLSSFVYPL